MGCIARLGCLIVLLVAGIVGYFTRDLWLPQRFRPAVTATRTSTVWEPLNAAGADRARAALSRLNDETGPAFQTISVNDLAAFAVGEVSRQLPGTVDSIATRTSGDTVFVRARVRIADLGGGSALGPLGNMLGDRETVQLGGTIHVVEPGLAELDVQSVRIRNLPIPSGMIPDIVKRLTRKHRPGSPPNAIDVPVPKSLGDVRVARGKATLYKSGQ
jgi:hypothetical protein